jgi:hypothetical protein
VTITKEQLLAAIDKCVAVRGNLGFFAEQELNAGEKLGDAFDLYRLVDDSVERRRILKSDSRVAGQQRVTNNMALLVIKLALQPTEPAHHSKCSDYGRVLEHMAKTGATRPEFVEVFSNGMFKEKLREARDSSPKRKSVVRTEDQTDSPELQIVLMRLGSAKTILRAAPIAADVDVTDDQQLQDFVLNLLSRTPEL